MRFRVFAALVLPPENQAQLGELLAGLQDAAPPGAVRWVRPEAMHLTVKFYGDVAAEAVPALAAGLGQASAVAPPMTLTLQGLGVFPDPRRPQVIWVGLGGDLAPLRALQAAVERLSADLGYAPETRPFKPHMTLGRVSARLAPADQMRLLGRLAARKSETFGDLRADTLSLLRSDLRPTGPEYTTILTAALGLARAQPTE